MSRRLASIAYLAVVLLASLGGEMEVNGVRQSLESLGGAKIERRI